MHIGTNMHKYQVIGLSRSKNSSIILCFLGLPWTWIAPETWRHPLPWAAGGCDGHLGGGEKRRGGGGVNSCLVVRREREKLEVIENMRHWFGELDQTRTETMTFVLKLALCIAWVYEGFFIALSFATATTILYLVISSTCHYSGLGITRPKLVGS